MDEFYLLVTARRKQVKTKKLRQSRRLAIDRATRITRVAKCSFRYDCSDDGFKVGRWWKIEVFDNPIAHMMDLIFVGLSSDPGIRAAEALAERMVSGLSLASGVKWEANCGPIDAEDAALLRIELEVLNLFGG
jgi:hypothetical protein